MSYGLATTPQQLQTARRLLARCLAQFADEGPTPKELERAKRMLLGGWAMRLQRASGRAAMTIRTQLYGHPSTYKALEQKLNTIGTEDVRGAMTALLQQHGLWTQVTPR